MRKEPRDYREVLDLTHPMASARIVRRQVRSCPGLYTLFVRTTDGGVLCPTCVRAEWSNVSWSHRNRQDNGWRPHDMGTMAMEDGPVYCDHCGHEVP